MNKSFPTWKGRLSKTRKTTFHLFHHQWVVICYTLSIHLIKIENFFLFAIKDIMDNCMAGELWFCDYSLLSIKLLKWFNWRIEFEGFPQRLFLNTLIVNSIPQSSQKRCGHYQTWPREPWMSSCLRSISYDQLHFLVIRVWALRGFFRSLNWTMRVNSWKKNSFDKIAEVVEDKIISVSFQISKFDEYIARYDD